MLTSKVRRSCNSLVPVCDFKNAFFNLVSMIGIVRFSHDNTCDECSGISLQINQHWFRWCFVSSGSKPIPDPMLTQFNIVLSCTKPSIWRQWATMSEAIFCETKPCYNNISMTISRISINNFHLKDFLDISFKPQIVRYCLWNRIF